MQIELDKAYEKFYKEKIKGKKLSVVEKLKAAHDFVIEMATYVSRENNDYAHNQDIVGALVNRKCVCNGFASAFKYICDRLDGLEVIMMAGVIIKNSERHAWNMAKVDDEFYHIDVTWDDWKGKNGEASN